MSGKKRVALWGQPQRSTTVEEGATVGATVGRDLYWPDGSVVTRADLTPAAPVASPSSGASIQFQDEGSDLGGADATTVDFTGAGVTASRSGSKVTVNVPGGGGGGGSPLHHRRDDLTAAVGNNTVTLAEAPHQGAVQVFLNGALLGHADYASVEPTKYTLSTPMAGGDRVVVTYWTSAESPGASALSSEVGEFYEAAYSQSTTYGSLAVTLENMTDTDQTTGAATHNGSLEWIKADLGEALPVTRVTVSGGSLSGWGGISGYLNGAVLEYSDNDADWSTAATISGVTDSTPYTKDFIFTTVSARYWRLRRNGYLATAAFRIYATGS